MKLFYQSYFEHYTPEQSPYATVIIIPGLFGSTGNWRSFAKQLSQYASVIVLDQRNHGNSPHSPQNSYIDLADDLGELVTDLGLSKVTLCGHSMGGKTAMTFALANPHLIEKLIVLDIAPVEYEHSHAAMLEGLLAVDLEGVGSRSEVEKSLISAIPDKGTRMFIMLSLKKSDEGYFWCLNLQALYDNLGHIGGFPTNNFTDVSFDQPCLFVKGAKSDYLLEKHKESLFRYFPKAIIETIDGAAHWLHIDKPREVFDEILAFIKKE